MNRSPLALPWIALCAFMAVIAGLAVTVASPVMADAQDNESVSLSLQVSAPVAEQSFRTVAVALDPGISGLAALGATLSFNSDDIAVSSCAVSEVGACNVLDGKVLFSVFNLGSLRANEQLLTINFEPTVAAANTTTLQVVATTAVNNRGEQIGSVTGDRLDVEIVAATFGSLTGTVVAADSATALFDIDLCATNNASGTETCTTTTGLGNWRIDDIETGSYAIVAADSTGVYATTVASGFVNQDEVASVAEIAMAYFTLPADEETDDTTDSETPTVDETPDSPIPATNAQTEPIVILYDASIAGRITGLETESAIVAAQVCATQPLVLHQSCATTDTDGVFSLSGLSTGNYWVEVVDPLGQLEQTRRKLVGVVGDDVARVGVNITLVSVSE